MAKDVKLSIRLTEPFDKALNEFVAQKSREHGSRITKAAVLISGALDTHPDLQALFTKYNNQEAYGKGDNKE